MRGSCRTLGVLAGILAGAADTAPVTAQALTIIKQSAMGKIRFCIVYHAYDVEAPSGHVSWMLATTALAYALPGGDD